MFGIKFTNAALQYIYTIAKPKRFFFIGNNARSKATHMCGFFNAFS